MSSSPSRSELRERPDATGGRNRARATSLPAQERRAAIVAAALPLVLESGPAVTTRQIAGAAGVAEGTIFGVFTDKDELLAAVVDAAFDPAPAEEALRQIDPGATLEARLVAAVDILRERAANMFQLMSTIGTLSEGATDVERRRKLPGIEILAALLDGDGDALRVTPTEAAQLLRGLTLVSTHPALTPGDPLSSASIVSLVLDGVRVRQQPSPD